MKGLHFAKCGFSRVIFGKRVILQRGLGIQIVCLVHVVNILYRLIPENVYLYAEKKLNLKQEKGIKGMHEYFSIHCLICWGQLIEYHYSNSALESTQKIFPVELTEAKNNIIYHQSLQNYFQSLMNPKANHSPTINANPYLAHSHTLNTNLKLKRSHTDNGSRSQQLANKLFGLKLRGKEEIKGMTFHGRSIREENPQLHKKCSAATDAIKWKQSNSRKIINKQGSQSSSNIQTKNPMYPQSCLKRAASHRRVNSSFKISDKLQTVSAFFKSPQRIKTQPNDLDSQSQLNPFSIFQHNHKLKLRKKRSKLQDLMNEQQLETSKRIIKQVEEMRKTKQLRPNPKQWQFHNCLSLQKIELYQTNLRISCEGWIAIDHLELKYLRGWNPKQPDDFSPMIRLFVYYIYQQLHDRGLVNLEEVTVRVNNRHILGIQEVGIAPHSILSIRKLINSMLITTFQDILIHSILSLGYVLHTTRQTPMQADHHIFIKGADRSLLEMYCDAFQQKCREVCEDLQLVQSMVVMGKNCLKNCKLPNHMQYFVTSTPLDIGILFMKCLAMPPFLQILGVRIYEPEYRFQVGWNFWENRYAQWTNREYVKYRQKGLVGRTLKKNQCMAVWDEKRNIVVVMADCKVNMHWKDIERVQHWVDHHVARFSNHYSLSTTFYPTDTEKFHRIN